MIGVLFHNLLYIKGNLEMGCPFSVGIPENCKYRKKPEYLFVFTLLFGDAEKGCAGKTKPFISIVETAVQLRRRIIPETQFDCKRKI